MDEAEVAATRASDTDPMSTERPTRAEYEAKATALVGRHLTEVRYWDIHNFGDEPRTWDYDDWHHAVMGVELFTDRGPFSAIWTSTFYPYGIEIFETPMTKHIISRECGPESWDVGASVRWRNRLASPISAVQTFWDRITVGPTRRGDVEVAPSCDVDVPIAVRIDFEAGPIWMVAAMPEPSDRQRVLIGADEVMVVFTVERMHQLGFGESRFLAPKEI